MNNYRNMNDNISLVCPVCTDNKTTSKLRISSSFSTSMGVDTYYDTAGHHIHDPNITTEEWYCSNGHKGQIRSKLDCKVVGCKVRGYREYWIENPREEKELITTPIIPSIPSTPHTTPAVTPPKQSCTLSANLTEYTIPTGIFVANSPTYVSAGNPIFVMGYSTVNLASDKINTTVTLKEGQTIQATLKNGKILIEDITTV